MFQKSMIHPNYFSFILCIDNRFVFYQMVEERHQQVVWNWMFVHVEVLTAG